MNAPCSDPMAPPLDLRRDAPRSTSRENAPAECRLITRNLWSKTFMAQKRRHSLTGLQFGNRVNQLQNSAETLAKADAWAAMEANSVTPRDAVEIILAMDCGAVATEFCWSEGRGHPLPPPTGGPAIGDTLSKTSECHHKRAHDTAKGWRSRHRKVAAAPAAPAAAASPHRSFNASASLSGAAALAT